MAGMSRWEKVKASAKAAKPYYVWLAAYYVIIFTSPLLAFCVAALILPLLALTAWLYHICTEYRLRPQAMPVYICASPFVAIPVVSILIAVCTYCTGTALIQNPTVVLIAGEVLVTFPAPKIDPVVRKYQTVSYWSAIPLYALTSFPYNTTLRVLTLTCGVMRGAYRGPYPNQQTSINYAKQHGQQFSREQIAKADWRMEGTISELSGSRLLLSLDQFPPTSYDDRWHAGSSDVKLALFTPECIIIEYRTKYDEVCFALFDVATTEVFARYCPNEGSTEGWV